MGALFVAVRDGCGQLTEFFTFGANNGLTETTFVRDGPFHLGVAG
jgi:hypothetical protein